MKVTPPKPIALPVCEHGHANEGYVLVVSEGEREFGLSFDTPSNPARWWVPERQAAVFDLAEIAAERRGIDPERADYELMPACCWRAGA